MFWGKWSRRLSYAAWLRSRNRRKSSSKECLPTDKTINILFQHPELLLQIIELTDVPTALNFRLVNRSYCNLLDKYELSVTRSFIDRLDDDSYLAGLEAPKSLPHLMAIHVCRELARVCASAERVPDNPYMAPEGIPADDPLGNKLREQITRGFMVMWNLSNLVPIVNRLDIESLIELANMEDLKGFAHAATPWDQDATEPSTLLRNAEKASRKSLVQRIRKNADQQAIFIARQKVLQSLWTTNAERLSEQDRIDFHVARSRIPEDFTEADLPWEKQYDHHKAWNWVPALTELDAELWFDTYTIQKGPYFLYSLWCEPDKSKRAAAWNEHKEASAAVRDYEIASAIATRSYLFTLTALGKTGLTSRARADFDRAYGRYCMEHFYRKQGIEPPEDADPLAFLTEFRASRLSMYCCFGGPDPSIIQRLWRQRAR